MHKLAFCLNSTVLDTICILHFLRLYISCRFLIKLLKIGAGLNKSTTTDKLREAFSKFGEVVDGNFLYDMLIRYIISFDTLFNCRFVQAIPAVIFL